MIEGLVKVSICIPAYNNPTGIKRLLDSVKMQTFTDYEVIITDDSTNDEVEKVVEASELDFRYSRNASRDGSTANWNKAIDLASGEYIKIMHHDDWFTFEDSLEKMVGMLDCNSDAVVAFSGTRQVSAEKSYDRCITKEDALLIKEDPRNLFLGNTIGAPSSVIHRNTDLRYDEKLKWLVDMDFYMSLLKNKSDFAYSTEPLVSIGVSEEQITNTCQENRDVNIREYKYVYEKHNLRGNGLYTDRLKEILISNEAPISFIENTDISSGEYKKAQFDRFVHKVKEKACSIKR